MARFDLFLKVEVDVEAEDPAALAAEICRLIRKVYGVRSAELSSLASQGGASIQ